MYSADESTNVTETKCELRATGLTSGLTETCSIFPLTVAVNESMMLGDGIPTSSGDWHLARSLHA